jgi:hypothetical protein
MTIKFRALIALTAMLGFAGAQAPRVTAAEAEGENIQCWYRVGIDTPNTCWDCFDGCMGQGYICCMGAASVQ